MIEAWIYGIVSIIIVSLISLIGIVTFSIKVEKLKNVLIYFISFSAGALLGDAFIHLLPEIVKETGFTLQISLYVLTGIAVSFIIEKVIHWRHCHMPVTKEHKHPVAIMNLVGDFVHNFIDGLIIGASYLVSIPVGIATTIAVILHEIPQEIADFGVLVHGGFSKGKALFMNFLTSLSAAMGLVLALALGPLIEGSIIFLIPFTVGTFIYIAGADLIPELHKETKISKSLIQFAFFVFGVLVMVAMLALG